MIGSARRLALLAFALLSLASRPAHADIMVPFVWSLSESAVALLPAIIVAEALILWRFGRVRPLRSLWVSVLVNVATTLVGVGLAIVGMPFPAVLIDLALVPIFFAATVAIEGRILRSLARELPRPYRLSLRMNLLSYAILIAGAIYFVQQHAEAKRRQRDRAFQRWAETQQATHPVPAPDGR